MGGVEKGWGEIEGVSGEYCGEGGGEWIEGWGQGKRKKEKEEQDKKRGEEQEDKEGEAR